MLWTQKFSAGALAASDRVVHRPMVSVKIRRFAGEEQGNLNRCEK